ncbi:Type II secretory pathway, component PulD [Alteromonadaceae bacterium Bs31]|nr:Type II secretory pathway, component PulD [Alteromonadaceae bacterium Bs31]
MRLLILLLCLVCKLCFADMQIYTIPLKHSPPETLIPALEPLLPDEGSISSHRNKLVVRTTPENVRELRVLVAQLDVADTSLLISMRRGNSGSGGNTQFSVNGEILSNSGSTHTSTQRRGNSITTVTRSSSRIGTGNSEFQVRGLSGRASYISTGEDIPVITTGNGPYGHPWPQSDYRSIKRGFYATPRVFGERVSIEISTEYEQQDKANNKEFSTEALTTTVSGQLGEWIPLGAISQSSSADSSGLSHYRSTENLSSQTIYLKVEKL